MGLGGRYMSMTFVEAIGEDFFNFANFRGRASRAEYWWWVLFAFVVAFVAGVLDFAIFYGWEMGPFSLITGIALFLPGLSVTVRRLHDTNRSGWWILLPLGGGILVLIGFIAALATNPFDPFGGAGLALVGLPVLVALATWILIIVWTILPSNPGNNPYGPNRYAGA